MKHYQAPWSMSLIVISSLATSLCLGVTAVLVWQGRGSVPWFGLLPLAIVVGSALFTIRGYTVTSKTLLVHRLFWTTRLPLAGLKSAQYEPEAMRRSIRTFGAGGLFSFSGWFRNKLLGVYRVFVTDPRRTVVLHFTHRTVVVSPAAPGDFVRDLPIPSHA